MVSWVDLLLDSRGINAIYGVQAPSLDAVDLHEVRLDRRSGAIFLRFDLAEFPSMPPKKWLVQGANTVQVELELFEARSVTLEGWGAERRVHLDISRNADGLIELNCRAVPKLYVTAEWVALRKISAHKSLPR